VPEQPPPSDPDAPSLTGPGTVALLAESRETFLRFVERRVGRRDVAEDLVQTAFAKGLARGDAPPESAVAWFYRVLRNAIVDHFRRRATAERRAADADVATLAAPEDEELRATVCACVGKLAATLKPEYAEALRRVELEGLAVKDYAARAGVTAANAGMRLSRARTALRRSLFRACGLCAEHGCRDCRCGARG
jgi:RNA polymerase sigma-70 factor (ECF subfamily)